MWGQALLPGRRSNNQQQLEPLGYVSAANVTVRNKTEAPDIISSG